jgi:GT2 family glycosyltransferase
MQLSVIVPCYNAESTLGETLEALAGQEWEQPWELLVVDNRSTDGSRAVAESFRSRLPNLRLIDATERQGQPYAIMTGVEAAAGHSVAFCDADDVVGAGWLRAMGEALEQHAIVAASIDVERLNSGWMLKSRGNNQKTGLQPYRYPPYLPHVGGGTMGVRRELFLALGGFDEALPYLHDTDFCWRAQLAGYSIQFVPAAVMHVRFRGNLRTLYRQARNYAEYNVLLYKRYRDKGMPPISLKMTLKSWWRMLSRLAKVRDKGSFGLWVWLFAQRIGRIQGSIKYRVLAL